MTSLEIIKSKLAEIKEREQKATPGRWKHDEGNGQVETDDWRVLICNRAGNHERNVDAANMYGAGDERVVLFDEVESLLKYDNNCDLDFIAHSRTDMPKLVEAVEIALKCFDDLGCMCRPRIGDDSIYECYGCCAIKEIARILGGEGK